jgi:hypothetical protein
MSDGGAEASRSRRSRFSCSVFLSRAVVSAATIPFAVASVTAALPCGDGLPGLKIFSFVTVTSNLLRSSPRSDSFLRGGEEPLSLHLLPLKFATATNGFAFFSDTLLGRLLISASHAQFPKNALTLELALQRAKGLINVVVFYKYQHGLPFIAVGRTVGK